MRRAVDSREEVDGATRLATARNAPPRTAWRPKRPDAAPGKRVAIRPDTTVRQNPGVSRAAGGELGPSPLVALRPGEVRSVQAIGRGRAAAGSSGCCRASPGGKAPTANPTAIRHQTKNAVLLADDRSKTPPWRASQVGKGGAADERDGSADLNLVGAPLGRLARAHVESGRGAPPWCLARAVIYDGPA